jgi:hypothetical protein
MDRPTDRPNLKYAKLRQRERYRTAVDLTIVSVFLRSLVLALFLSSPFRFSTSDERPPSTSTLNTGTYNPLQNTLRRIGR